MRKLSDELPPDLYKENLDYIAKTLPEFPPLKPGGDITVREWRPDLTEEELDYVMSKYTGTMERG